MASKKEKEPQIKCSAQWFKLFPELGLKVELPKEFIGDSSGETAIAKA